jgi:hypothetical protein
MLQIMSETKCFYVFLEAGRYLTLISPKPITCKFLCKPRIYFLYFTELGKPTLCSASIRCIVIFECNSMQKKDDFFGQIGNVAAGLALMLKYYGIKESKLVNLDKTFSPVVIVINICSERFKFYKEDTPVMLRS